MHLAYLYPPQIVNHDGNFLPEKLKIFSGEEKTGFRKAGAAFRALKKIIAGGVLN